VTLFDTTQNALERAIAGAGMRQNVLAQNIANANTPGYRRQDVDFQSSLQAAMSEGDPHAAQFSARTDNTGPVRADGNNVDIDTEAARSAQNALQYDSLVSVARARIDIIKAAMGQG
jgi:flagellar basal-body rod protein FlgB